jgi:putative ABC transport system permease protein
MSDAALTATALARSWRQHRGRAVATLASAIIGILMVTMVVGVVKSILTAVDGGTGLDAVQADLVIGSRSTAGFDQSVVDRVRSAAAASSSATVTFANTRLAHDQSAVLTIIGIQGDAGFVPAFPQAGPTLSSGERTLQLSAQWASRYGLKVGDHIDLSGPGGTITWRIGRIVPASLPNGGAIAVAARSDVDAAFDRTGTDVILLRLGTADRTVVAARIRAAVGDTAIVGSVSDLINPEHSSFAQIRQILLMIGAVGTLTAGTVLFVCWRLLVEDERDTIARLRLLGAKPKALAIGAGLLFLALTFVAVLIGVPLGFGAAIAMTSFARKVVSLTGLAASPQAPGFAVPALAGAAAGFVMAGAAWAIGLRAFLKVPAIQAVRAPEASAPRRAPVAALVGTGLGLIAVAIVASHVLPDRYRGSALLAGIGAVVVLAIALPIVAGAVYRRRNGFTALATGRELAAGTGKRSGTIAVLAMALVFSIGLSGLAASLSNGLRTSVQAWTKGSLFVLPAQPGVNLRDEKFPTTVPDQLQQLPGIRSVVPFSYTPYRYQGRNIQLYAWGQQGVNAVVDLHVANGVRGDALWTALGAGNVAVSDNFAWLHHLKVGDTLKLPAADGTPTAPRIVATINDYTGDTGVVFTSYTTFTALTGDPRPLDLIVTTDPGTPIATVKQEIRQALGTYPGLTVWTGSEMRSFLLGLYGQVLAILQAMGLFFLGLAILLGVTTAVASVSQRRLGIGLSRLIGNTRRQLSRQLVAEAMTVGGLAWIIAVPIGLISGRIFVYAVGSQSGTFPPVQIPWVIAAVMLVPAIGAAAVAVLVPSRRLLKVNIAEMVTYE